MGTLLSLPIHQESGRVRWTRDAFRMMSDAGLFEGGRYELIHGEILRQMPNEPHTWTNMMILRLLVEAFGWDYVRMPGSIAINSENEPQPDVAVTMQETTEYLKTGIPPGSEFRLVVEVSDTTLARDRNEKARLYAQASIPEYWVINIKARTLIVHREPVDGEYRNIQTYDETVSIVPLAAPTHQITLSALFPPIEA
jgi:Uma2 family endonuclease